MQHKSPLAADPRLPLWAGTSGWVASWVMMDASMACQAPLYTSDKEDRSSSVGVGFEDWILNSTCDLGHLHSTCLQHDLESWKTTCSTPRPVRQRAESPEGVAE